MATRREMQDRRAQLRKQLIEACSNEAQKPGSMLPPLRELAKKYSVSPALASEVVRSLADEGLLYTQQGAGTFVGRLATRDDLFLLIVPDVMETDPTFFEIRIGLRNGFESSLTRLGGTCLTLSRQKALEYRESGNLQGLVGVAEFCPLVDSPIWDGPEPVVTLHEMRVAEVTGDAVYVDNEDAGHQATRHLLSLGHRHIAFIGTHRPNTSVTDSLDWSRQRQQGWQAALENADCYLPDLAFCPEDMPENSVSALRKAGYITGRELIPLLVKEEPGITAIIVSNGNSTEGVYEAFREARLPDIHWPAIVSFDDYTAPDNHLMSVLRPSWEELGRQGAALLWERGQGRLNSAPEQRPVEMELIPRFSCRPQRANIPHQTLANTKALSPRVTA
ncbi:GntR family transcriptional regulator [bacterium]|nr:MAG: GntR family transcriptional regulator [bacterium]